MIRRINSKKKRSSKRKSKNDLPKKEDQFAWLADFRQVKYYDAVTNEVVTHKFKNWSLLWNPITNELIGIKNSLITPKDLSGVKNKKSLPAMKAFIAFQDYENPISYDFSKNWSSRLILPLKWELLGKGKAVDYWSDKFNKLDFWTYYHKFGEYDQNMPIEKDHKVMVWYDKNNKLIKMAGGKLTVTERGIIN